MLLRAARRYGINPGRWRGKISNNTLYKAGALYASELQALLSKISSNNRSLFVSSRSSGFLDYKMNHAKLFNSKIRI